MMSESSKPEPALSHVESLPTELAHQVIDDLPLSTILKIFVDSKPTRLEDLVLSHPFWTQIFQSSSQLHHTIFMFTVLLDMKETFSGLPVGYDPYDRILRRANLRLQILDRSSSSWTGLKKSVTLGNFVKPMRDSITTRLDYLRQVYGRNWLPSYKEDSFPEGTDELVKEIGRLHHSVKSYAHKREEIRQLKERQIDELIGLLETYPYMFRRNADPFQVVRPNFAHKIHNVKSHAGVLKLRPRATKKRIDRVRWLFADPDAIFVPHDFLIAYFIQTLEIHGLDISSFPKDFANELKMIRETVDGHINNRGIDKPGSRTDDKEQLDQLSQWIDSFPIMQQGEGQSSVAGRKPFQYPHTILDDIKTAVYGLNHNYLLMSSYGRDWTAHHATSPRAILNILRPESANKKSKIFIKGVDEYEMELFPAEMYRHRHLIPRDTTEIKWLLAFARSITYMREEVNPANNAEKPPVMRSRASLDLIF